MELQVGNRTLKFNQNQEQYNKLRRIYSEAAISATTSFDEIYDSCGNIDTLWTKFGELVHQLLYVRAELSCKILFECDIFDITADIFLEKYYYEYMDVDEKIQPLTDRLAEISEFSEALEYNQRTKESSRGRWSGGGFGVGGAIKGAITASAFHAIGGAFHGIGDAFANSTNSTKVKNLKSKLFSDPNTRYVLSTAIYYCCFNAFLGLRDELVERNIWEPITFQRQQANAIQENALKYAEDMEQQKELLIKGFCMAPYSYITYKRLLENFPETVGLEETAEYLGVDQIYQFFHRINSEKVLRKIAQMPINSVQNQCDKIAKYLDMQKQIDITSQLKALIVEILNENRKDKEKYRTIISFLNERYPVAEYPCSESIHMAFSRRIQAVEKAELEKMVDRVNRLAISEKIDLLSSIFTYRNTYNDDIHDLDMTVIRSLIGSVTKIDDNISELTSILNQLSEMDDSASSPLTEMKEAIQGKICGVNYELKLPWATLHLCSLELFDVVQEARNGNPACQAWLIRSLCPDELLANSISDFGFRKWALQNDVQQQIEDSISFLFDDPRQYEFDFLMRLRLSLWTESQEEYFAVLDRFRKSTICPAGLFEYGKYAFYYSSEGQQEGIAAIQQAALSGYYPASIFLVNLLKNEELSDETGVIALCNQLRMSRSYRYSNWDYIYKFACASEKDLLLAKQYHVAIDALLGGQYSMKWRGASQVEMLMQHIWKYLKGNAYVSDSVRVGFATGTTGEIKHLNTVCKYFKGDVRSAIFSYYIPDKKEGLLLSIGEVRWCSDNKIYCSQFDNHSFSKVFDSILEEYMFFGVRNILRELCSIAYYASLKYDKNVSVKEHIKRACVGDPLSTSLLLQEASVSQEKKQTWAKAQREWRNKGNYFAVCPGCKEPVGQEDVFCSECGSKIQK